MAPALSPMQRELRVVPHISEAAGFVLGLRPRTLLLSGGSTPRSVYERLATSDLPWAGMECWFGDERCVPPSDERSNERMAREALLSRVPVHAHPMDGAACDAEGYERKLRERFHGDAPPAFDVAFLGIGDDGHTASLFPGAPELEERERWVVRVDPPPGTEPAVPRLSVTLPVLNAARVALFLIAGASKREALARLLRGDDIPAARVHAQRIVILADGAAGAGLEAQ